MGILRDVPDVVVLELEEPTEGGEAEAVLGPD